MGLDDPDEVRLPELLLSVQTLLLRAPDVEAFVRELAGVASQVAVPPASCGISLRHERRVLRAHSDRRARTLDEQQYDDGAGPCLLALVTREAVDVADVAGQRDDSGWPSYTRTALERGVRSSLSLPLTVAGSAVGALNLYSTVPHAFDRERRRAELFAAQVSTALALAMGRAEQAALAADLEHALASRSVIDQAVGVLMAQQGCNADAAFDLLRRHSQNTNRKLREVAADVITRLTGTPPAPPHPFGRSRVT